MMAKSYIVNMRRKASREDRRSRRRGERWNYINFITQALAFSSILHTPQDRVEGEEL